MATSLAKSRSETRGIQEIAKRYIEIDEELTKLEEEKKPLGEALHRYLSEREDPQIQVGVCWVKRITAEVVKWSERMVDWLRKKDLEDLIKQQVDAKAIQGALDAGLLEEKEIGRFRSVNERNSLVIVRPKSA